MLILEALLGFFTSDMSKKVKHCGNKALGDCELRFILAIDLLNEAT